MKTKIKLMWLGHSAFKMVSPKGKIILIDPFLTHNPTTPESEKTQSDVDYILLTHGHEDHVGDTLDIAAKTGAKVVSIVELSGLLKQDGLSADQAVEMNKGGSIHLDDFTVTMTNANHSSSFGGRYAGDPAGLMIKFDDDITVYHAGDTNIMPDFELYQKLYSPKVSLLPIGDYYTMGVKEASLAAKMLKSKVFIPMHFGTFPVLTGSAEDFKATVQLNQKSKVLLPKAGEWISL
jgi:L-ascorbate metabolism protein UlaG (beta-lactamase superfamily)